MRPIKSFRSKNELVYESIRSAILQGELAPGERLVIDEIASTLDVSQIPVREALRQLESDGFVTIRPYVGAAVTQLEADRISEVFHLLEAMEIISGKAACVLGSDDDLARLEDHIKLMDRHTRDPVSWSADNAQLHQLICDIGHTPLVKNLMTKVLDHWSRLHNLFLQDVFVHRIHDAQKQHWALFEAIRSRDPEQLEQIVREHNQSALLAYQRHIEGDT